MNAGYEAIDREVEDALLKSALGYSVTVRKPVKLQEVRNRAGEGRVEVERIEYAEEEVHVPGKITAQIYWLRHRAEEKGKADDVLAEVLRRWDEGCESGELRVESGDV